MILATKKDLEEKRVVEDAKVKELCEKNNIDLYFEVNFMLIRQVQKQEKELMKLF